MLAGTAKAVACCTKTRQVTFIQQFINDFIQGTVIVNGKLLFVEVLFFVFTGSIGAQLKLSTSIDLTNTKTHNFIPYLCIFTGGKNQPGVRHSKPQNGNKLDKLLIADKVFFCHVCTRSIFNSGERKRVWSNIVASLKMVGMAYHGHYFKAPVVQFKQGANSNIINARFLSSVKGREPVFIIGFWSTQMEEFIGTGMVRFLENLVGTNAGFSYFPKTFDIQRSCIDVDTSDFTSALFDIVNGLYSMCNIIGVIIRVFTINQD